MDWRRLRIEVNINNFLGDFNESLHLQPQNGGPSADGMEAQRYLIHEIEFLLLNIGTFLFKSTGFLPSVGRSIGEVKEKGCGMKGFMVKVSLKC